MSKACACGCGNPAIKNRFYARGHKPKRAVIAKRVSSGKLAESTAKKLCACGCGLSVRSGRNYAEGHRVNGVGNSLLITTDFCDAIWKGLPLEKKAGLLNKLGEV